MNFIIVLKPDWTSRIGMARKRSQIPENEVNQENDIKVQRALTPL